MHINNNSIVTKKILNNPVLRKESTSSNVLSACGNSTLRLLVKCRGACRASALGSFHCLSLACAEKVGQVTDRWAFCDKGL